MFGNDVCLHIFADSLVQDGRDCRPTTDSALLLLWYVSLNKLASETEHVQ